ncbi:MAG TPA: N-acetylmannosamine-6-phosphate 2-epimerase [Acidobacteriaceae bacterium]|jgi:putative N-acetylmannosamine-6-phosphate epimerase|nr:N-acetylmannosamine-6-phosphate 2-epimerase [Acidobacteriaceae bacterium]
MKERASHGPFPEILRGHLIASCQAAPGDPMDHTESLRRMAISTVRGGARGLRANGAEHIAAFRRELEVPIIGIEKHYGERGVEITPNFAAACRIAAAGAHVIALDCTSGRTHTAEPWQLIVQRIHRELHLPVLADIATLEEGIAAEEAGVDAVATTLSGYTPETARVRGVQYQLIANMAQQLKIPVIAEGHIARPEQARRVLDIGAYAVVVGSAITRPENIARSFVEAMQA